MYEGMREVGGPVDTGELYIYKYICICTHVCMYVCSRIYLLRGTNP
jgi:hypothetical protein